jgi:hypothetical protein
MDSIKGNENLITELKSIELELKKRLVYKYHWGTKQNNACDRQTNFIYDVFYFDELLKEINKRFSAQTTQRNIANYALNRWYNFWSAYAVEKIFCSFPGVIPAKDSKDRLVDFSISGIKFDHKTSIYPKNFPEKITEARANPSGLISWLYKHQSREKRLHTMNRLFIVLFSDDGAHWKLKSEIFWLKKIIEDYVAAFNASNLKQFNFEKTHTTLSDIIWAVR